MARPYSLDLRERVVQYLEKGNDKESAAEFFSVGIATIYRWLRQRKKLGSIQPIKRERAYQKIDNEQLKEYVEAHPDHFLSEIARHFNLTPQAIFYALKRLKITRKKRLRFIRKEMKSSESNS